mmetsp:Transcript_33208/g.88254  ORF Transcript_33208/g.88254 Transcript_33208/m.88254 type:complete len:245 (+) Transcript_33208:1520-2254(+)
MPATACSGHFRHACRAGLVAAAGISWLCPPAISRYICGASRACLGSVRGQSRWHAAIVFEGAIGDCRAASRALADNPASASAAAAPAPRGDFRTAALRASGCVCPRASVESVVADVAGVPTGAPVCDAAAAAAAPCAGAAVVRGEDGRCALPRLVVDGVGPEELRGGRRRLLRRRPRAVAPPSGARLLPGPHRGDVRRADCRSRRAQAVCRQRQRHVQRAAALASGPTAVSSAVRARDPGLGTS